MAKMKDSDSIDLMVVLNEAEYRVASALISERKSHREVLGNLHTVFKRDDARRILDNLPYQGCQMMPMLREKSGRKTLQWISTDSNGLVQDLKMKFEFYCKNGQDFDATAAHNLMKKVESAPPAPVRNPKASDD